MRFDKIYNDLKSKYSDQEIAESMVIPAGLEDAEEHNLQDEIKKIREKQLTKLSEKEQIISDVVRLRFQIEEYLKNEPFSFEKTFGTYLKEYIRIVKRSHKKIAENLSIHPTKLSRIVNDKDEPNVELCYRLEEHSAELISALTWWKLIKKKEEFIVEQDIEPRRKEQEKVSNSLKIVG